MENFKKIMKDAAMMLTSFAVVIAILFLAASFMPMSRSQANDIFEENLDVITLSYDTAYIYKKHLTAELDEAMDILVDAKVLKGKEILMFP